jgi:hypothetical protein
MNLLQLILDGVRQRGGRALWAWVGLMLATWLVVYYSMDRQMARRELIGAGFVYGVLVLGGAAVVAKLRAPGEKRPSPRKKRR